MSDSTLIVTAQDIEFAALIESLRSHGAVLTINPGGVGEPFKTLANAMLPSGEQGGSTASVFVIVPTRMGRVASALATQWATTNLSPKKIIVVGAAGSLAPDRKLLGALMVATSVIDASEKRYGDSQVDFRDIVYECSSELRLSFLSRAEMLGFSARTTQFLCTDSVIASASFRDELAAQYPSAGCVEMESGGVGAALANEFPSIPWLSVRAIVDLSDACKRIDAERIADEALHRLSRITIAAIGVS